MKISISAQTFDLDNYIILDVWEGASEYQNLSRRVNRTATLDSGVVIQDNGWNHGDRIMTFQAEITQAQWDTLYTLHKDFNVVTLTTPDGAYQGNLSELQNNYGIVTITFMVESSLSDWIPPTTTTTSTTSTTTQTSSCTSTSSHTTICSTCTSTCTTSCTTTETTSCSSTSSQTTTTSTKTTTCTSTTVTSSCSTVSSQSTESTVSSTYTSTTSQTSSCSTVSSHTTSTTSTTQITTSCSSSCSTVSSQSTQTSSCSTVSTESTVSSQSSTTCSTSTQTSSCTSTSSQSTQTSSCSTVSSESTVSSTCSSSCSTVSSQSTISSTSTNTQSTTCSSTASTLSTQSTTSSTKSTISSTSSSTISCDYNDYFNSIQDHKVIASSGGAAISLSGNTMKVNIPNSTDCSIRTLYKYILSSGDFDLRVDISEYSPEDINHGSIHYFWLTQNDWTDFVYMRYYLESGNYKIHTAFRVNGVDDAGAASNHTVSKMRIVRDGSTIRSYYWENNQWNLDRSKDFGGTAQDVDEIHFYAEDNPWNGGPWGGYIRWDNLVFAGGCPDGSTTWTSTSTSTTSNTTTSTTPPPA